MSDRDQIAYYALRAIWPRLDEPTALEPSKTWRQWWEEKFQRSVEASVAEWRSKRDATQR
jgi:hypothetical protein